LLRFARNDEVGKGSLSLFFVPRPSPSPQCSVFPFPSCVILLSSSVRGILLVAITRPLVPVIARHSLCPNARPSPSLIATSSPTRHRKALSSRHREDLFFSPLSRFCFPSSRGILLPSLRGPFLPITARVSPFCLGRSSSFRRCQATSLSPFPGPLLSPLRESLFLVIARDSPLRHREPLLAPSLRGPLLLAVARLSPSPVARASSFGHCQDPLLPPVVRAFSSRYCVAFSFLRFESLFFWSLPEPSPSPRCPALSSPLGLIFTHKSPIVWV